MTAGRFAIMALLAATLMPSSQASAETVARIAIIIDDLGYQLDAGRRAIELPGAIAFAILPGTPHGRFLAKWAHRRSKEVLLHLPLEAVAHEGPAEPSGITLDMSRYALQNAFSAALESVPFAIGVSSHRGSLLTQHPGHMNWLMQEIRTRDGLFFIDSYTTHASIALKMASEAGVVATRRDVFLDNDRSEQAMEGQFERLTALARRRGVAVGIGHPYPETLAFLERRLLLLGQESVELITLRDALTFLEPDSARSLQARIRDLSTSNE